jgi:hypothetical protein
MPDRVRHVDDSDSRDLATIFYAEGSSSAEIEALAIKSLLEANGIAVVMVGDSVLPNLPFELRVARDQAERARQLITEAQRAQSGDAESPQPECDRG